MIEPRTPATAPPTIAANEWEGDVGFGICDEGLEQVDCPRPEVKLSDTIDASPVESVTNTVRRKRNVD